MPHAARAAHLDKRRREILQALPSQRAKALILPALHRKVRAIDASEASMLAVVGLAAACGSEAGFSLPTRMSHNERELVGAFGPISLKSLLSLLQRLVVGESDAAFQAAAEVFLVKVRDIALRPSC